MFFFCCVVESWENLLFSLIAQGEFIELDEIHALQMVHISRNTIKVYNCRERVD